MENIFRTRSYVGSSIRGFLGSGTGGGIGGVVTSYANNDQGIEIDYKEKFVEGFVYSGVGGAVIGPINYAGRIPPNYSRFASSTLGLGVNMITGTIEKEYDFIDLSKEKEVE